MTNHLIAEHLIADRRASAMATARRHRLATAGRPTRWWSRRVRSAPPSTTDGSCGGDGSIVLAAVAPGPGEDLVVWADALGHVVAERGIGVAERQVAAACRLARSRQLVLTCAEIAADRAQPAVARERALGRVLAAITEPYRRPVEVDSSSGSGSDADVA